MHLQYKVRLATGETTNGVGAQELHGAERDPVLASVGSLALLAQRIADAGVNVRLVSGKGIETGGSVEISVGSDDEQDHEDEEELERLLDEYGYEWEAIIPTRTLLRDEVGALAAWAREIAGSGRLIDSIALGTPGRTGKVDGRIPLHATTLVVGAKAGATRRAARGRAEELASRRGVRQKS